MDCAERALSFITAWEKADYADLMSHFAPATTVRDHPRGAVMTDSADIKAWMEAWRTACPDSTAGATVPVATADGAVMEGIYAGTNTGPLGPFPATGRSVSMPFSIVMRFDDAGRITEYSVYYDQMTLLTQLGHVNPAG